MTTQFKTHTRDSAPEGGREILDKVGEAYGFVPNLVATLVESPQAAAGYTTLSGLFGETSLSPTEQQVVLLAASRENDCEYCVAAHSTIADSKKIDSKVVDAIREDRPIEESKLEALRRLTSKMSEKRGWLDDADVEEFLAAGYGRQQVLEVLLGLAMKTLSNYSNHIAATPLDDAFAARTWKSPGRRAA